MFSWETRPDLPTISVKVFVVFSMKLRGEEPSTGTVAS